jgi:hypothetical protein
MVCGRSWEKSSGADGNLLNIYGKGRHCVLVIFTANMYECIKTQLFISLLDLKFKLGLKAKTLHNPDPEI